MSDENLSVDQLMILIFYATIEIYSYYKKKLTLNKICFKLTSIISQLGMYDIFSAISITKK